MGKIHDALQRAEKQRARLSGARPSVAPEELIETPTEQVREVEELEPLRKPEKLRMRARREKREKKEKFSRAEKRRARRIAKLRDAKRSRVVVSATPMRVGEEYRTLRARLQSLRRIRPLCSLVVTSSRPGEGKTTTAINLALSFGLDRETNTCLVDADLRTPAVQYAFPEMPIAGLGEILEADAKLDEALVQVPDTRLSVLPVKALPTHPSELLGSRAMMDLIEELHGRFDTVVIDAPPILGLPDAVTLVDLCDAALLVVRSGFTPRDQVEASLGALDTAKIVGSVLNRCEKGVAPYGGSGYRS